MYKRYVSLARQFIPSAGTLALLWLALGIMLVGLAMGLLFYLTAHVDDPLGTAAFIVGLISVPLSALVVVVAAFVEKARAPRALLWGMVGALLLVSGSIVGLAMALDLRGRDVPVIPRWSH